MDFKIIPTDRVQVYLLFYKPKDDDPFLNRLVAFCDGPYCHVEMAFPERWGEQPWEREIWGSSIYQKESVFFKPKTYGRDGYFSIAIEVSVPQMRRIKAYCKGEHESSVPFNSYAMYGAYFPLLAPLLPSHGTFCSKHVTKALQHGGVDKVKGLNPSLMTPSKLFKLFDATNEPILHILPSKLYTDSTVDKCTASMVKALM
jgi:hypothetical protein